MTQSVKYDILYIPTSSSGCTTPRKEMPMFVIALLLTSAVLSIVDVLVSEYNIFQLDSALIQVHNSPVPIAVQIAVITAILTFLMFSKDSLEG